MDPKPPSRRWDPNWPAAAAFLAPNFIGFLCFTLFPVLLSFAMAYHYWTLRPHEETQFVGLLNFADVLGVHALAEPHYGVLILYLLCVLGLILGLILWKSLYSARPSSGAFSHRSPNHSVQAPCQTSSPATWTP